VVVGSIAEIHVQSNDFRTSTSAGYGDLAGRVATASNGTGARLAALVARAPQLTNTTIQLPTNAVPYLNMARTQLQQGLDQAVRETTQEANQAAQLVPPPPSGDASQRFTQVMEDRATAVSDIRTAIDQMLGMTSLPVGGAPSSSASSSASPLTSPSQAASSLSASGSLLQQADRSYGTLRGELQRMRPSIHVTRSVWVPTPVDSAALGSTRLGGSASALDASAALHPFHQLVMTAVGLSPPAVAGNADVPGGWGIVGGGCAAPQSAVPGATPTVLPPTASVGAAATVTNCGTVGESGVVVTQTLELADPAGTAPPPAGSGGGTSQTVVTTLRSGSSTALTLKPIAVASGHRYRLTLAIVIPASQQLSAGSTQQFLLQIS
jgi:hypothetical protein